jgi:NDP-sugar pyrophosphorylase family protein
MKEFSSDTFFCLNDFMHKELFLQIDFVWQALQNLEKYLRKQNLGKIEVEIPPGVYLEDKSKISIGKGTVLEPGSYIKGPCIIGPNCRIVHGAYIRESVVTGSHCVIGHATEIKHSILLNRVEAPHFNYVGDSILGNDSHLGAGANCANLRLDKKLIAFYYEGKKIETGLKKLGLILGDGAQIGCNAVTNPGTFLGKNSICYPCTHVNGYGKENSIYKGS